jgi:hypothetical protein
MMCGDKISLLGFGFLRPPMLDGAIDYEHLQNMVNYAIEYGVNYFDTAFAYLSGESEIALGRVLQKHDRAKVHIATKVSMYRPRNQQEMSSTFNIQLKRLNTGYIDYYLFHAVKRSNWYNFIQSGLYDFLCEKKEKGKIRHIGFSFHDTPDVLMGVVEKYDWDFAQIQLNYLDWKLQSAEEQYAILAKKNIPIIVMEPVRGGELARLPDSAKEKLAKISKGSGATDASYAIRWAASFSQVACVLSGMSSMEHVLDNVFTVKNFEPISSEEQLAIDEAVKIYISLGGISCTGCGYCVAECPKEIAIPQIFSLANDYTRTKDLKNFYIKSRIISAGRRAGDCINCGNCVAFCPQNVDIPGEIEKIRSKLDEDFAALASLLQKLESDPVVFYGAGVYMQEFLQYFHKTGMTFNAKIWDKNAMNIGSIDNINVTTPDFETCVTNGVAIIMIEDANTAQGVRAQLEPLGYTVLHKISESIEMCRNSEKDSSKECIE